MVRMVQMRYFQLKGSVRNYRQVIAQEVKECFGIKVSREILRWLFAIAREEHGSGERCEKRARTFLCKKQHFITGSTLEIESPA